MTPFAYPVDLSQDDDGVWLASIPDIDVATDGVNRKEALEEASGCLDAGLTAFIDLGRIIPPPSAARGRPVVAPDPLIGAKAALHNAVLASGMTNVQLAKKLGVTEGAVRSLRDPGKNASIAKLQSALEALGARIVISLAA